MSTRDARLNTIGEIKTAFMTGKEVTVWNYEPGDAVAKIQSANDWADAWLRIFKYDLSTHWFSIKEDDPEYRAFKTVEEVEPFIGHTIRKACDNGSRVVLVITGAEEHGDGSIRVYANGCSYTPEAMLSFKFVKTGKPVGIEVK